MAKSNTKQRLNDIIECSICQETYTDPVVLPCIHTFCLACLQTLVNNSDDDEQFSCPLCRKQVMVPDGGVNNLLRNLFIEKLLEINKTTKDEEMKIKCDNCDDWCRNAKWHCLDCSENFCEECGKVHQRQRTTKSHKCETIGSQSVVELLKVRPSYCNDHQDKKIELYCKDGRHLICLLCFAENHKTHTSVNIKKISEDFRQQLQADADEVSKKENICREVEQNRVDEKRNFLAQSAEACMAIVEKKTILEKIIDNKFNELRRQVDIKHMTLKKLKDDSANNLLAEIETFENLTLKEMELSKEGLSRQKMIIESFLNYLKKCRSNVRFCNHYFHFYSHARFKHKLYVLNFPQNNGRFFILLN